MWPAWRKKTEQTLCPWVFISAEDLTRWVWDQWIQYLRLQSALTSESRGTLYFARSQKGEEHYGEGETSQATPAYPHSGQAQSGPLYALTRIRVIWP